jgi:hypothetical protein
VNNNNNAVVAIRRRLPARPRDHWWRDIAIFVGIGAGAYEVIRALKRSETTKQEGTASNDIDDMGRCEMDGFALQVVHQSMMKAVAVSPHPALTFAIQGNKGDAAFAQDIQAMSLADFPVDMEATCVLEDKQETRPVVTAGINALVDGSLDLEEPEDFIAIKQVTHVPDQALLVSHLIKNESIGTLDELPLGKNVSSRAHNGKAGALVFEDEAFAMVGGRNAKVSGDATATIQFIEAMLVSDTNSPATSQSKPIMAQDPLIKQSLNDHHPVTASSKPSDRAAHPQDSDTPSSAPSSFNSATGFDLSKPTCAALSLVAVLLVYKGYSMCRGNGVNSSKLCALMHYWLQSLQRCGHSCGAGDDNALRFNVSNYEALTVDDIRQVLKEGFNFKANGNTNKLALIQKLCERYEAALKAMKKADIHEILGINGVKVPNRMKKDDLIFLALELGF